MIETRSVLWIVAIALALVFVLPLVARLAQPVTP